MSDTLNYGFRNIPPIYFEHAANVNIEFGNIRLYLTRNDAPIEGGPSRENVAVAQLIMSSDTFFNTFFFFERIISDMVKANFITQEQLDALRAKGLEAEEA